MAAKKKTAKKKAAAAQAAPPRPNIGRQFTGETSVRNVRRREGVLGTPKERQQSRSRIEKREAAERGARRRVAATQKKIDALNKRAAAGKIDRRTYKRQLAFLREKLASDAKLSKRGGGAV